MAMKEYFTFSKALALLEPRHQIVYSYNQGTHRERVYLSAEVQSVYSTAPADWARKGHWKWCFFYLFAQKLQQI